jgi:serine/threonine protein kinase
MELMVRNKYVVREFIGKGKFGMVFKGNKIEGDEKPVAIKLEKKKTDIPLLKNETRILEYLARNGVKSIVPQVFWYGLQEEYVCLVMTYLGEESLCPAISLDLKKDWFKTAKHILETIHLYGIVHRDLKPGHFIRSNGKWVLIDFGFSIFVSDEDALRKREKREYIIGTPNYISIRVHQGFSPGKKDDMVSLGYIFLELCLNGRLPWTDVMNVPETTYPNHHILHPANQFRQHMKETMDLQDIPELANYLRKWNGV